jgi:hypothetical protein
VRLGVLAAKKITAMDLRRGAVKGRAASHPGGLESAYLVNKTRKVHCWE